MLSLAARVSTLPRFMTDELRYLKIYTKYKKFTMIGERSYIGNLRLAAKASGIPGSIVECGTWRGGMIAGIADVLGSGRTYYLVDSFEGLPPAKEIDGPAALAWQSDTSGPEYFDNCRASEEDARMAMAMSSATEYQIVKGWFDDTLPKLAARITTPIALLRLDADWYDSTKCVLANLASYVVPGEIIVIDDYYTYDGCTKALNEAAALRNWRIRQSRLGGVCFIKV